MNPEQALIAREDAATLRQALQRLPARHERVLRLWYGIGCEPMIFKDIGAQLGVVGGRAQQMAREAERRLRMPLMCAFPERPSVQRIRRERDEAHKATIAAQESAQKQHLINEGRREAERQRQSTVAEILRIAEEVELELDQIPRQRKQRNPFGFSPERAAEFADVLRGMMRA